MPGLKELQAAFKHNLLSGDPAFAAQVMGSETLPNELRLAIYQNAYRARLVEALATDYEQLHKLLGDEAFTALAHAYIQAHPSRHFSLRWFGRLLPDYLGYAEQAGSHDWQAELAKLEWSFTEAFDAADAEPLTEMDAAQVPAEAWPGLRLGFHPAVRHLSLWWNTLDRWRAAKHDEAMPEPKPLSQPGACLLWRQGLTTQYRSLSADEALALQTALAGGSFAEICGALAEELQDQEQVPMLAAGYLKSWLASGMLVGLDWT